MTNSGQRFIQYKPRFDEGFIGVYGTNEVKDVLPNLLAGIPLPFTGYSLGGFLFSLRMVKEIMENVPKDQPLKINAHSLGYNPGSVAACRLLAKGYKVETEGLGGLCGVSIWRRIWFKKKGGTGAFRINGNDPIPAIFRLWMFPLGEIVYERDGVVYPNRKKAGRTFFGIINQVFHLSTGDHVGY